MVPSKDAVATVNGLPDIFGLHSQAEWGPDTPRPLPVVVHLQPLLHGHDAAWLRASATSRRVPGGTRIHAEGASQKSVGTVLKRIDIRIASQPLLSGVNAIK